MMFSKLSPSRRALLPVWLLMAGWMYFGVPGARAAGDAPAELILRGAAGGDKEKGQEILTPSAAFEWRCVEELVAPERVGTEEAESPSF